jgi:hypothetical protein
MDYLTRCVLLVGLCLLAACSSEPKNTFSLVEATISDVQNAVKSGQLSCRAVVEGYIARINEYDRARGIHAITAINPKATKIQMAIITAGFSIKKAAIFSCISRPATAKLVRIGFLPIPFRILLYFRDVLLRS